MTFDLEPYLEYGDLAHTVSVTNMQSFQTLTGLEFGFTALGRYTFHRTYFFVITIIFTAEMLGFCVHFTAFNVIRELDIITISNIMHACMSGCHFVEPVSHFHRRPVWEVRILTFMLKVYVVM